MTVGIGLEAKRIAPQTIRLSIYVGVQLMITVHMKPEEMQKFIDEAQLEVNKHGNREATEGS